MKRKNTDNSSGDMQKFTKFNTKIKCLDLKRNTNSQALSD